MSKLELEQLIISPEIYEAHFREGRDAGEAHKELLKEHVDRTAKYFRIIREQKYFDDFLKQYKNQMCEKMSREGEQCWNELIEAIPVFHDLGKINPAFQIKRMKNTKIKDDGFLSSCIGDKHSLISAVLYLDYFFQKVKQIKADKSEKRLLRNLIILHSYLIARHHSDLCDFNDYMKTLLCGEGRDLAKVFLNGEIDIWIAPFCMEERRLKAALDEINKYMIHLSRKESMALYIYEKLLYSLLVAADYYATAEFMAGAEITQFGNLEEVRRWADVYENTDLMQNVRKYQREQYPRPEEKLKRENNINILRTEMLCDAEKILKDNIGETLFYLEAPTGSGKSNTAVDLCFQLMQSDERLQKIFYIYPFNTLVEQNIKSMQKIFGEQKELFNQIAVVNSLTPIKMTEKAKKEEEETEDTMYYQRALLDRQFLNYPIILSTHVSLFDIIFGDTKESAFSFHQLMNSVIVLDEIQSYKNNIWSEISYFLKELASLMHIKIIIMSATLPDFDLLTADIYPAVKLMENKDKYFANKCFKNRVEISYELLGKEDIEEVLVKHAKKYVQRKNKVLIEFIKKDSAYRFFEKLKSDWEIEADVELMSGDDSIAERNRVLNKVKSAEYGIILVATQVIEAGVDIDMDIGYKNISKLDSEEQFLGRINRSCLRSGKVYFFKLDDGSDIYHGDVRIQKSFTLENEKIREILVQKDFQKYYKDILNIIKKNWNENVGETGLDDFFHSVGIMKWGRVREKMRLIEDDQWSMSVFLARTLEDEAGNILDGRNIWKKYVTLLNDSSMEYAEKKVRLSEVSGSMNNFIYQIRKNPNLIYNDKIGEIFYIEEGEKYFNEGKLERRKLQDEIGDFVDFI